MQRDDSDPHGTRLPIKIDTTSNGEFAPIPLSRTNVLGNRLAHERATEHARRSGMKRRDFLMSSCGAASALLAFNAAHAAGGRTRRLLRRAGRCGARCAARSRNRRRRRVHLRRAGTLRRSDRRVARRSCRRPRGRLRRCRTPRCGLGTSGDRGYLECLGPQRVREGRLSRFRHRHDGVVVRAVGAGRRTGDDRGGRRNAPHRR